MTYAMAAGPPCACAFDDNPNMKKNTLGKTRMNITVRVAAALDVRDAA